MVVTVSVDRPEDLAQILKVQVPPGESGAVEVKHVEFSEGSPWPRPGDRPPVGVYTELRRYGEAWMSDYPCETVHEQYAVLSALNRAPRDSSILILGLGLGVILRAALLMLHKGPIDVLDLDADVMALMQPHYEEQARIAGADVRFHLADAHTWPIETRRWAIGWADVWRDLSEENLPSIERLAERYGPRCLWYDSWSRVEGEFLRSQREAGRLIPGIPIKRRDW